jgi:hypothetical protein
MPIFVVGDEAPAWVRQFLQADMATLIAWVCYGLGSKVTLTFDGVPESSG